jgi:hypothetical protein
LTDRFLSGAPLPVCRSPLIVFFNLFFGPEASDLADRWCGRSPPLVPFVHGNNNNTKAKEPKTGVTLLPTDLFLYRFLLGD